MPSSFFSDADATRLLRGFAPVFVLCMLLLAAAVGILSACGIGITGASWRTFGFLVAVAGLLVLAAGVFAGPRMLGPALTAAFFLVFPAPLAMFSYATAALGASRPLVDPWLIAADGAIGFDWLATLATFNQWPGLITLLGYAYHGTIVTMIYVFVFLNVIGRQDRVVEFAVNFLATCVVANVLAALWPALGAYVVHQPASAIRDAISADAGVWHLAHFEALRAGTFRSFDLTATEGLVTFPSFHTAAALLVPVALRGYGPVTWLAWAVALVIVVSTVPIGGHYLVDIIAGAAMTAAVVALMRVRSPGALLAAPRAVPETGAAAG